MFSVAFVLGFIGSLHCVGMCGPIALALPMGNRNSSGRLLGGLLYNGGRIVTYSWLGLVLGLVGRFLITPTIQQILTIGFGGAILLYLLLPVKVKLQLSHKGPAQKFMLALRSRLGILLRVQTNSSLFGIGLLNGLLPCGMIYMALTTSFITGNAVKGALFMLSYGLGTLPAMMGAVYFGSLLKQPLRLKLRKAVPAFLALMAVMLVLRGLNLGIPYLSPGLPVNNAAVICK